MKDDASIVSFFFFLSHSSFLTSSFFLSFLSLRKAPVDFGVLGRRLNRLYGYLKMTWGLIMLLIPSQILSWALSSNYTSLGPISNQWISPEWTRSYPTELHKAGRTQGLPFYFYSTILQTGTPYLSRREVSSSLSRVNLHPQ